MAQDLHPETISSTCRMTHGNENHALQPFDTIGSWQVMRLMPQSTVGGEVMRQHIRPARKHERSAVGTNGRRLKRDALLQSAISQAINIAKRNKSCQPALSVASEMPYTAMTATPT